MGYTNYHYQKESFTDEEWEYIQHHKKKITRVIYQAQSYARSSRRIINCRVL